jgi:hypothetical protein
MTNLEILAVLTPVMAFLFMGLIALVERHYDRAPAIGPGRPKSEVSSSVLKTAAEPAHADEAVTRSINVRDRLEST